VKELTDTLEGTVRRQVRKQGAVAVQDLIANGLMKTLIEEGVTTGAGSGIDRAFLQSGDGQRAVDEQVKAVMDLVEKAARRQSERVSKAITDMDAQGASMKSIEAE